MRRILTEIKLEKVAAVSSPAQEGALALIVKAAPKQQQDDDQIEDDWSKTGSRRKKQKPPKPWGRTEIDQVQVDKRKPAEHPFMRRARALSQKHNVPLYLGMSAARREDPASHRHFVQSGVEASQPKIKKAAPDADVCSWNAAITSYVDNHQCSRTEAMSAIRKAAPKLWQRFRR